MAISAYPGAPPFLSTPPRVHAISAFLNAVDDAGIACASADDERGCSEERIGPAMERELTLVVNGERRTVRVAPDTPLLYVLRDDLGLNGPRFGCGLEQCGACMVLRGAEAVTSCRLPVSEVGTAAITTVEGLASDGELHPVQRAFLEIQAAQCGYCSSGMLISAAALLWRKPHPTDDEIRAALDGNLCRCGSHTRIVRAVQRAAQLMWEVEA
jgi:nicotinate dehydrogenase subunit A